jgi:hypothetical protein
MNPSSDVECPVTTEVISAPFTYERRDEPLVSQPNDGIVETSTPLWSAAL